MRLSGEKGITIPRQIMRCGKFAVNERQILCGPGAAALAIVALTSALALAEPAHAVRPEAMSPVAAAPEPATLRLAASPYETAPVIAPPTILRIFVEPRGAAQIEGTATAGARVRVMNSGQSLAYGLAGRDGKWIITLTAGLAPGEHRLTAEVVTESGALVPPSEEVRISIPSDLKGSRVLAYTSDKRTEAVPPPVPRDEGEALSQVRRDAEALAHAAGEAYDSAVTTPKPEPQPDDVSGAQRADETGSVGVARPAGQDEAQPQPRPGGAEIGDVGRQISKAIVGWLERSAAAFEKEIMPELSVPASGKNASPEEERKLDEMAEATPTSPGNAAERLEKARRELEEAARANSAAILEQRRLAEESRAAVEAARKAEAERREAERRKAAEEFARRKLETERRISDELKHLEAAKAAKEAERLKALREKQEQERALKEKRTEGSTARLADNPDVAAKRRVEAYTVPYGGPGSVVSGLVDKPPLTVESTPGAKPYTVPYGGPSETVAQVAPKPSLESSSKAGAEAYTVPYGSPSDDRAEASIATAADGEKTASGSSRCPEGLLYHRNGKRWYVSSEDDTLWDIAERVYGNGMRYKLIYRANRRRMSDPDILRPCLRLRLPSISWIELLSGGPLG